MAGQNRDAYEQWCAAAEYEEFVRSTYQTLVDRQLGTVQAGRLFTGRKTGHAHQIDVSIELRIADLSLTVLVECKHYKSKVGIADLLEFAQRIDDIGAHKGVLVSTVGFQEGAIRVADAHGIALVITKPIWQVIRHCVDAKGESVGASFGELQVGGCLGGRFAGVTIRLLNADVRAEPDCGDAWAHVLEFLQRNFVCRGCGGIQKVVAHGRCRSLPDGFCRKCFFGNLALQCPKCSTTVREVSTGVCDRCGTVLSDGLFEQHSLYRCACGRLMNKGDLLRRSARCGCGYVWNDEALEDLWSSRCAESA